MCSTLARLHANGMSIKPSKCIWLTEVLPFLGHLVVAKQGVKRDTNKVKAVLLTKPPEELSLLRRFIGQSVWLSKQVEDHTRMVGPLRAIVYSYPSNTKADISHVWLMNLEALNAFNAIKLALCSQPLLSFPQLDRPFSILVDASGDNEGDYGACLAQMDA